MKNHRLSTCRLDIRYNNEQKAGDLQSRISRLFHAQLSKTIAEVCDICEHEHRTHRIEFLEVDLGEIEEGALEHELPARLKEKLREMLEELIGSFPETQMESESTTPTQESNYLEALHQFLVSGYISWEYRNLTGSYPAFLDKVFSDYQSGLLHLIRKNITNQQFRERLVRQFGQRYIGRLIGLMAPNEAQVVMETARQVIWLEEKEQILTISGTHFEQSVWELVLIYLVQDRGSYFNTREFLRSIIRKLAHRYQIELSDYLLRLHMAVQYLALYHSFRYAFPRLLEELYHEEQQKESVPPESGEAAEAAALHFYLSNGYLSGKHATVSKERLLRLILRNEEQVQGIIRHLQRHMHHENERHRILALLEEPGARKIVTHLEPAGQQIIFDFAETLQKKHETQELLIPESSRSFRLIRWDFIIYTLLNDRGSIFNTKSFILHTLQTLANRYAQDSQQLLRLFLESFPASAETSATPTNLIAAITQLKKEYASTWQLGPHASRLSATSKNLLHSQSKQEQLIRQMKRATKLLLEASEARQPEISLKLYALLASWLETSLPIPDFLKKQLRSDSFKNAWTLPVKERTHLMTLAPDWMKNLLRAMTDKTRSAASVPPKESYLSLLEYFITSGEMPWWTHSPDHQKSLQQVVLHLIRHRSSATKEFLINLMRDEKKRHLLVRSLHADTLTELLMHLSDLRPEMLRHLVLLITHFHTQSSPVVLTQNVQVDKWHVLFTLLLDKKVTSASVENLVRQTLLQLAPLVHTSYITLIGSLAQINQAYSTTESKTWRPLLKKLQSEESAETSRHKQPSESETSKAKKAPPSVSSSPFYQHFRNLLLGFFQSGKTTGSLDELEKKLSSIPSTNQDDFLLVLRELPWTDEKWTRFTRELPEHILAAFFENSSRGLPFMKNYLSDWIKILKQISPEQTDFATRIFYELSICYLASHRTVDKHEWFSHILTRFSNRSEKQILEKFILHMNQPDLLLSSTIRLSLHKWRQAPSHKQSASAESSGSQPTSEKNDQSHQTEKTPIEDSQAEYWLENCGLTLLWPFMDRYFSMLQLLENRTFKSPEAAYRGAHLLQFLVTGQEGFPEYQLILNKILCGIEVAQPISKEVQLTDSEKQLSEDLLKGVIQNWSILGNTSIEGLRTTFLMRAGILRKKEDFDQLHVESEAFDVLIDKIPWSYSTIKLPWMKKTMHVQWR